MSIIDWWNGRTSYDREIIILALGGLIPLYIGAAVSLAGWLRTPVTRREARAGAPIYRGRWSALVWVWWSGELLGETSLFNGISLVEWVLTLTSVLVFLPLGIAALDRYGRNAWFDWSPPGTTWHGVKRDDVNRETRQWTRKLITRLKG